MVIPEGRIILVEWKNQLHEINYQIGIEDREKQLRKLKYLFSKYKNQFEWSLWLDNGFGKFFESSNHTIQGMWAYQLDTISFVSQEFYEAPKEPNK